MKRTVFLVSVSISVIAFSCKEPDPNVNKKGEDELESLEIERQVDDHKMDYQDILYVPIYSDIYVSKVHQENLLAATLSIRNTSYNDSLFISKVDYFNTRGDFVRSYIKSTVSLPPMATINYVVEKRDDTGGNGAKFIVALSAKNNDVKPLVQAIMIGDMSNKAFAFSTDGYSIKK